MSETDREALWCHDCGTYSYEDEWESAFGDGTADVCPECGEVFPGSIGPYEHESAARRWQAAERREVVW